MTTSQSDIASSDLGTHHFEYRRFAVGFVIGGLVLAVLFGWGAWVSFTRSSPNLVAAIFMGLLGVGALGFVVWAPFAIPRRIGVYEEGLVVEMMIGRQVVRWSTVTSVRSEASETHSGTVVRVEARTVDGRKLVFAGMPSNPKQPPGASVPLVGIQGVFDAVIGATASARLAVLRSQYEAGRPVEFGKFQLSHDGISAGGRTLRWPMVADIQADYSLMVIKEVGQERPWGTFKLVNAPNADILPDLVAAVRGTHFSAFHEGAQAADLEAARRRRRTVGRVVSWLLVPLLIFAVNLAISLGGPYLTRLLSQAPTP